VTDGRVQANN